VLREFGGQFSNFKNALVELCVAKLSPIASEMKRLWRTRSCRFDSGRRAGRARAIAAET